MPSDDHAFEPPRCPSVDCPRHETPGCDRFYRYKGSFTGSGEREARRYQCRTCGRSFSERTFAADYRARRPDVDRALPALLAAGASVRLAARLLGVSRRTVQRRLRRRATRS